MRILVVTACAVLLSALQFAAAKPPLEAYAEYPASRAMKLSPDGSAIALISRLDGVDRLMTLDLETGQTTSFGEIVNINAQDIRFLSNTYLILDSTLTRPERGGFPGSVRTVSYAVNRQSGEITELFGRDSTFGRVLSAHPDGEHVHISAFTRGQSELAKLEVFRINLRTGFKRALNHVTGHTNTLDWIVDEHGEIIAREDYDDRRSLHSISVAREGQVAEIYSEETPFRTMDLAGVTPSGEDLVLIDTIGSQFRSVFAMSRETGDVSGPLFERSGADIEEVITIENRVVVGVRYSGMRPTYQMFDEQLTKDIAQVQGIFPHSAVHLASWSAGFEKLLFSVSGGSRPEQYFLFQRTGRKLAHVINTRPLITDNDVGQVQTIEYRARDGLTIPAVLTWPARIDEEDRKHLPLIVLPHGGPEAYDAVGFDWLAQFLANEGYLVLQPNFRGSSGFGGLFQIAGHKEWGRKMQTDIEDGANALTEMGWADPERMCIVGWSYGGYAALAAGALTPDLYKCVASIAGVSDLDLMLEYERQRFGRQSSAYRYWTQLIGDPAEDRDAIRAVSPSRLAERFSAPVLLIHGRIDNVVPVRQSRRMQDALDDLGKPVRYLEIGADDHNLIADESRIEALEALGSFLAEHLKR